MPLKPWYKVVTPREDLREGNPLDAAEFAVHLDDVRNNCAPPDYQQPDRFFARTCLKKNVSMLAGEVMRRVFTVVQACGCNQRKAGKMPAPR